MKHCIVFFPSWRYFGHFALPLFEPLTDRYKITFFHTEAAIYGWDDFPDLSAKSIQSVDLHSLDTFSFVDALKQLKPDCVIVLDKGWVQDRAILHAARFLSIPTIQIQHGSVAIIEMATTKFIFKRALTELVKVIRTFRLYNATLVEIGIGVWQKSLQYQLQLLINPNNYYYNYRDEITADYVCITGALDREFFVLKEGYREEQLVEMGNRNYEKAYAMRGQSPGKKIHKRMLLISQPLFEDHILRGGYNKKKELMEELLSGVNLLKGVSLAVKPHPREDTDWYRKTFSADELHVYDGDTDVNDALFECQWVIGFFSAALVNAVILRKPLGIVRWVDDSMYGLDFDKDGAAISLAVPSDLKMLAEIEENLFDPVFYAYNRSVMTVLAETINRALISDE